MKGVFGVNKNTKNRGKQKTPKRAKEAPLEEAVTFQLESDLKRKLEDLAIEQRRSVSFIVRSAVEQFLAPKAAAA